MTQQALPLNYASPMPKPVAPPRAVPGYFVLAVAVAVGILGANGFADAAGFPVVHRAEQDPGYVFIRVLCGFVVALLTAAIILFSSRFVRSLIVSLAQTRKRPETAVVITLIITGSACLISTILIPVYFSRDPSTSIAMSSSGEPAVRLTAETPIVLLLAILTTIAGGAVLLGVGIWGSLRPQNNGIPQ